MVSLTAGKNNGERRDPEETVEEKKQRKAQIKRDNKVRNAPLWSPHFASVSGSPPVLTCSPTQDRRGTVSIVHSTPGTALGKRKGCGESLRETAELV